METWQEASAKRAERIDTALAEMGFNLAATFVPQSVSRNAGNKEPSLNWRVAVTREGRSVSVITDYQQGIGHVPGYSYPPRTLYDEKNWGNPPETGKYRKRAGINWSPVLFPLPSPELRDILHSMLLDATARDMTFSDWCADYYYSDDSIIARKTYDTCLEIGIRLAQLMSSAELETLRELFQDY
jgi:hypothetical protein